jgi:hypothetical protein
MLFDPWMGADANYQLASFERQRISVNDEFYCVEMATFRTVPP